MRGSFSNSAPVTATCRSRPPARCIAGADAIATAEQVIAALQQQVKAYRALSTSLAIDEARS
jgi:hypothetical protein